MEEEDEFLPTDFATSIEPLDSTPNFVQAESIVSSIPNISDSNVVINVNDDTSRITTRRGSNRYSSRGTTSGLDSSVSRRVGTRTRKPNSKYFGGEFLTFD